MPIATPAFDNGSLHAAIMALSQSVDTVASELDELSDEIEGLGPGFLSSTIRLCRTEEELRAALLLGGIIIVEGQITVGSLLHIGVNGTRIWGYGSASTGMSGVIIDSEDFNTHVFFVAADDVQIANLEISGAQAFPSVSTPTSATLGNHTGIAFDRQTDPSLQKGHRFHLFGCHIHNLHYGVWTAGSFTAAAIDGISIRDCWFHTFSHSGILASFHLIDLIIAGNIIEWRRDGETHVIHPDTGSPHTAGNCIWVGEIGVRAAKVVNNRCSGSYKRWGIEFYLMNDSLCDGNTVEKSACGISITGTRHTCVNNNISGADGADGAAQVASIEVNGFDHIIKGNIIWDGVEGVTVPWGIVITGETARCEISHNNIRRIVAPIAVTETGPVKDISFKNNTITVNDKSGENTYGISLQGVTGTGLKRFFIEDNFIIGPALVEFGPIIVQNTAGAYIKRNVHISPTASGEPTVHIIGTSTVFTDDANTSQTANPITLHTNTRINASP
jgi:hypothetical protein